MNTCIIKNNWAKTKNNEPGISVEQHMLTVGHVTLEIIANCVAMSPIKKYNKNLIFFLACAHDIGKHSIDFLQKCEEWIIQNECTKTARNYDWKGQYSLPHSLISQDSVNIFIHSIRNLKKSIKKMRVQQCPLGFGRPLWVCIMVRF